MRGWSCLFFFFNDTATTEIYTLSLHDALPISRVRQQYVRPAHRLGALAVCVAGQQDIHAVLRARDQCAPEDRKSTRLNSSHSQISYAVFCLKKKIHPCSRPCVVLVASHPLVTL